MEIDHAGVFFFLSIINLKLLLKAFFSDFVILEPSST